MNREQSHCLSYLLFILSLVQDDALAFFQTMFKEVGQKIFLWFQIFTQIVYAGAPTSETYEYEIFRNKDSGNSQNRMRLLKWDLSSLKKLP